LAGEVITQLHKGDLVVVLEVIAVKKTGTNAPSHWAKIQMPTHTPVWLKASLLDTHHAVIPYRLNLRAGPGINHSMVGQLPLGRVVKPIRLEKGWAEVSESANAYAFVAADLLAMAKPASVPAEPVAVAHVAKPIDSVPASPPTHPEPEVASRDIRIEPKSILTPPPVGLPPPLVEEPLPRRIVVHEGVVKRASSIQAPTYFELRNPENGKLLDYLEPLNTNVVLKKLRGTKVIVTGEEVMDVRWPSTPVIKIQALTLAP
jgi:hypothetical protein